MAMQQGGLMGPGMALLQAALKQQQGQSQPQGQQATLGARLQDAVTPKPDGLLMMLKGLMSQGANGPQLTPPAGPAPSPLAGLQMPMGGFGAPMSMAPPMAMGGGFMPDIAGGLGY